MLPLWVIIVFSKLLGMKFVDCFKSGSVYWYRISWVLVWLHRPDAGFYRPRGESFAAEYFNQSPRY